MKLLYRRLDLFKSFKNNSKKLLNDNNGYSLIEILVVIVIIGILAMLAIPRFMNLTNRAKMVEAQTMLQQVHTLQTTYYYMYSRYSSNLDEIGFEQVRLISDGGTARYIIEIEEADQKGFIAIATSEEDFSGNGNFNVWEVNQHGEIRQRVPD